MEDRAEKKSHLQYNKISMNYLNKYTKLYVKKTENFDKGYKRISE